MVLDVIFLGTSGSIPTRKRSLPSVVIRREGEIILFDCGEGTQRQITTAKLSSVKISRVFLTHMHGDHVLGLPGLIQSMALLGRIQHLEIYGPPGTSSFLEAIRLTVPHQTSFPISVHEVSDGIVYNQLKYRVMATWVDHSIPSLAYSFIEKPKPGHFKPTIAEKLGVPKGPLWKKLQMGEIVEIDGRKVDPSTVVGPPRPGIKIAYSGDTRPCKTFKKLAEGSDIVIHESTFDNSRKDKAKEYGHSTAQQAAQIANEVKASRLILTHISPIYEGSEQNLLEEAKEKFQGQVILADDFTHIKV